MANERVWMHKKTGQLYEMFDGCFGEVVACEDLTHPDVANKPIDKNTKISFSDEYDAGDFIDLGEL